LRIRLQNNNHDGHERRFPVKLQGDGEAQDKREAGLERNQEPRGVESVKQLGHVPP